MISSVLEDHVEQAALQWLTDMGWDIEYGPNISPTDAKTPGTERDSYRDVVLAERLREAIRRVNPHIPSGRQDEAAPMLLNPNLPRPVQANRQMHRWRVEGVPVQFQKDGETREQIVKLITFQNVANND